MEGQEKDSKPSRSRQRHSEEADEDHYRDSRKKDKLRKDSKAPASSKQIKPVQGPPSIQQAPPLRYHHREVPPRFQHQKQGKHQKYTKPNQVNKKPMKDSGRWPQPPAQQHSTAPHQRHHRHHQMDSNWRDDDGGWSRGFPERGSGWGTEKDSAQLQLEKEWTTSAPENAGVGDSTKCGDNFEGGRGGGTGGGAWLSVGKSGRSGGGLSDSDTWGSVSPGRSNSRTDTWTSDHEVDSSGGQSAGENGAGGRRRRATPSQPRPPSTTTTAIAESTGKNGGGGAGGGGMLTNSTTHADSGSNHHHHHRHLPVAADWEVGDDWKLQDFGEDLDRELASELDGFERERGGGGGSLEEEGSQGELPGSGGRGTQEGIYDWDELDAASHSSSSDRDTQSQSTLNSNSNTRSLGGAGSGPSPSPRPGPGPGPGLRTGVNAGQPEQQQQQQQKQHQHQHRHQGNTGKQKPSADFTYETTSSSSGSEEASSSSDEHAQPRPQNSATRGGGDIIEDDRSGGSRWKKSESSATIGSESVFSSGNSQETYTPEPDSSSRRASQDSSGGGGGGGTGSRAGLYSDGDGMGGAGVGGAGTWPLKSGRPSAGSTSSMNSVGSSSSWKGEREKGMGGGGGGGGGGRGYQNKATTPRKPGRYDSRTGSLPGPLTGSSGGPMGPGAPLKARKGKKQVLDLEDALESLHQEPSGWGDLPSPRHTDGDNGTEFWGVPPADQGRGRGRESGKGMAVWGKGPNPSPSPSAEWGDTGDDPSGALAAGWGQTSKDGGGEKPGGGGGVPRWGSERAGGESWNTTSKPPKEKAPFAENHKKLVDMGFSHSMSEKYLKANGNDIDAAIGDLLAVAALGEEELSNGTGFPLQNGKNKKYAKPPTGSPLMGGPRGVGRSGALQGALGGTPTGSLTSSASTMSPAGTSTPTSSSVGGLTPGFNPKDVYQQLASLQTQMFAGSIPGLPGLQAPPLGQQQQGQQPQQQQQAQALQNQLLQMQLLQMQQRYLLGSMFPAVPNLHSYQQLLTQQLGQMQVAKQQLTQQLHQLKSSSGIGGLGQSAAQQQQVITVRLNYINHAISQINQQLVLLSQLSNQQKEAGGKDGKSVAPGGGGGGMGSPQIGRNTPPMRNKVVGDIKLAPGAPSRSNSLPCVSSADLAKNLSSYGMQGLSLAASGAPSAGATQSSARSVSRLQQIISGSASSDNLVAMATGRGDERQQQITSAVTSVTNRDNSPISAPAVFGSSSNQPHSTLSGPGTPSGLTGSVTTAFPASKPVTDIQEFKPGVPWQPRSQPTEPAQLYSKPTPPSSGMDFKSSAGGSGGGYFASSPMKPSPAYPFAPSPRTKPGGTTQQTAIGSKLSRQHSAGSPFYGTYPPPIGSQSAKYGSQARDNRQSWSGPMMDSGRGGPPYGQNQMRSNYANRGNPRGNRHAGPIPGPFSSAGMGLNQPPHPASPQPYGAPPNNPGGRKQQLQQSQPQHLQPQQQRAQMGGGQLHNRFPPAANSYPYHHQQQKTGSGMSQPPPPLPPPPQSHSHFSPALGPTANSGGQQQHHHHPHQVVANRSKTWGSEMPHGGGGSGGKPWDMEEPRHQQQNWGFQPPESDHRHPWHRGMNPSQDPADTDMHGRPFASPPSQPNTLSSPDGYPLMMPSTPLESLSSATGRSAWSQDGLQSSRRESIMLSPEPTFAEWQAGKKAHLSVFKLPSNPPSSWLLLRNITSQVDEPSLRDVCSEYGSLQTCLTNPALECALVHYNDQEEAIQAKTGLDKHPSICGINVVADFAADANISYFYEQLSFAKGEGGEVVPPPAPAPGMGTTEESTPSWFNEPIGREMTPETLSAATKEATPKPPKWDDPSDSGLQMRLPPPPPSATSETTSAIGTPAADSTPTPTSGGGGGSSLWGDGSFLSGLSSPWHENVNFGSIGQGRGGSGGGRGEEPGSSGGGGATVSNGSSSFSTFLPNGIL